jgi:molybdopterin molybdotransferase
MFQVKTVEETISLLQKNFKNYPLKETTLHIDQSIGYITSKDIHAQEVVPSFNRSTVDGYAVKYSDTLLTSESSPVMLEIIGEVHMGKPCTQTLKNNTAIIIPTGGHVPENADVCIMIEHTETLGNEVLIYKKPSKYDNMILIGQDINKGQIIVPKNTVVTPQIIGALHSQNIKQITVFQKQTVSVISTGDEIISEDRPLKLGEVRDINTHTIKQILQQKHFSIHSESIIKDNYDLYKNAILAGFKESDIIITSGASSVGEKDYTIQILKELNAEIIIHGLNIKPGKPTIIAKYNNKLFLGLPGHPSSSFIVLHTLIDAIKSTIYNIPMEIKPYIETTLLENVHNNSGRLFVQLVHINYTNQTAIPIHYKSSMITNLIKANGYILIPSNTEGIYKNEIVKTYKLGD